MSVLFALVKPLLHSLPAETAHDVTLRALRAGLAGAWRPKPDPVLRQNLFGLDFPNPLGLAAGFDKNAEVPDAMLRLGLGFVECGTVTPRAQAGNPRPRIFRLPRDRAVINRLGFNNRGLDALIANLETGSERTGIVGINIGANKDTADKADDYATCLKAVLPHADYVTVNVSSPNTPGLRGLQDRPALEALLATLTEIRNGRPDGRAALLLKVAPDLDSRQTEEIAEVVLKAGIDGLIVSNTTIARPDTLRSPARNETGGLSGGPLFQPSTVLLGHFHLLTEGRVPLIGVGGVANASQAYAKIRAGASLVQLYTGLVYGGPGLIRRIVTGLGDLLRGDGYANVTEAIGADVG